MRLLRSLALLTAALAGLAATGCRRDAVEVNRQLDFDEFIPVYNRYIQDWLVRQQEATRQESVKLQAELAAADAAARPGVEGRITANALDAEKWKYRLELGDYLKIGTPADVPSDLVWHNGQDQPEIGDPAAKKGGVYRTFTTTFPPTIRQIGDNANNGFRSELYDNVDMKLVFMHPLTNKLIPGVADEWALSADGRTTYFRLAPGARYSDGEAVTAKDYLLTCYIYVSDNTNDPYPKQYFRENVAQIAMYDDHTLSVSLPDATAFASVTAGELIPSPPHFFKEYGPDFNERYQWRFRPTTGAYEVKPEDIVNGVSITQTRIKDWWAKDRKFFKYRFNPDKIVHRVIRDDSKAFELFRAGELDSLPLTRPQLWYEKSEIPPVYDGYIERYTFYRRWPKIPFGIYMNTHRAPLNNKDVRIGINYAMNWKKVNDVLYRGDYERLNSFNEGYTDLSDPDIRARPYSVSEARARFAAAGYTEEGPDGILRKPGGERLSISLTYPSIPAYERIFMILREDARNCGFEMRLDGLEVSVSYKKSQQKQHEMTVASWGIEPPMPDFYQFLHSSSALDDKGNPKPQTNNIFVWGREDTDRLSMQVRTARTIPELAGAMRQLQRIMHDEGMFNPGYSIDYIRIGSWRWMRWPDTEDTRFSPPITYDPHEIYVYWIDDAIKEETMDARRSGRTYPEVNRVIDTYREVPAANPTPNP